MALFTSSGGTQYRTLQLKWLCIHCCVKNKFLLTTNITFSLKRLCAEISFAEAACKFLKINPQFSKKGGGNIFSFFFLKGQSSGGFSHHISWSPCQSFLSLLIMITIWVTENIFNALNVIYTWYNSAVVQSHLRCILTKQPLQVCFSHKKSFPLSSFM